MQIGLLIKDFWKFSDNTFKCKSVKRRLNIKIQTITRSTCRNQSGRTLWHPGSLGLSSTHGGQRWLPWLSRGPQPCCPTRGWHGVRAVLRHTAGTAAVPVSDKAAPPWVPPRCESLGSAGALPGQGGLSNTQETKRSVAAAARAIKIPSIGKGPWLDFEFLLR